MPKKFTLLCHFNYYGRIWVILLEFVFFFICLTPKKQEDERKQL